MNDNIDLSGYKRVGKLTREQIFGEEKKVVKRRFTFFDEDGNIVDKDDKKAVRSVVTDEDELGRMISETFGEIRREEDNSVKSR